MRVWRTVATLAALGCVMSHMLAGIGGHPTCPPWLSLLGVVLGNLLFPAIHTSSFDAPPHWRITIISVAGVWHGLLLWQHQYVLWGVAVVACVLLYALWWIDAETTPLGRTQDDEIWAPYCFLCLRLAQAVVGQVNERHYYFLDNIRDETRVTLGWCAARRKSLTAAAKRLDDRDRYAYTARHELLSHISDMIEGPGFSWADRDDAIVLARRVLSARARWVLTEEDNR
jgi:hypothetical protein